MVENDTTTSKATITFLGATITLVAIGVYQLQIILHLYILQFFQLPKIVEVVLKGPTS